METFWYQLTQVYLEKWPLKWRESIILVVWSAVGVSDHTLYVLIDHL